MNDLKTMKMDSNPCPTLNEDEISNANTEDSLLGSRKSTETISSVTRVEDDIPCCSIAKEKKKCGKSSKMINIYIYRSRWLW